MQYCDKAYLFHTVLWVWFCSFSFLFSLFSFSFLSFFLTFLSFFFFLPLSHFWSLLCLITSWTKYPRYFAQRTKIFICQPLENISLIENKMTKFVSTGNRLFVCRKILPHNILKLLRIPDTSDILHAKHLTKCCSSQWGLTDRSIFTVSLFDRYCIVPEIFLSFDSVKLLNLLQQPMVTGKQQLFGSNNLLL